MVNPERTSLATPAKAILKRIDIGLTTGVIAVLVAFLALLTSMSQTRMAQESQKASVLPIIQVDMGYHYKKSPSTFEINLTNSGVGIAYIQRVQANIKGKPVAGYQVLQDAVMNGRMSSNATLTETPAAGYLRAGDTVTPWHYTWGSSINGRGEIEAYLRGQYGPPMDGVDIEVCYCSIFDDCWKTSTTNTAKPKPVSSCGKGDVKDDFFADIIAEKLAEKLNPED